ncbi:MAG: cyclase family protein [Acidobacteria bacterium]|nr:cyclase family protein [Acidobacteriota bacterium]
MKRFQASRRFPLDLTLSIDGQLIVYPGDPAPRVHRLSSIAKGAALTVSSLELGCHVGTHVDAPSHFLRDGASLDQLPLAHFHGPAQVVDMGERDAITAKDVQSLSVPAGAHILLKTKNSRFLKEAPFRDDYCYLTPEAAEILLSFTPLSIGIDYYSLDPPGGDSFPAHIAVAGRGLPVFVCLDLADVEPGEYSFSAFPLNIPGLEGSPVRALLFARESLNEKRGAWLAPP